MARVASIQKDRTQHRPVPVLHILSRVFKQLSKKQLYEYLNKSGLLESNHSGLRKLRSIVKTSLPGTNE